jgi:glycosyltransferase involved in cell wall biosynthesis
MLIGIDASRAAKAQRTGTEGYAYHLIRELVPLAEAAGHRLRLYFQQQPQHPISDSPAVEHVVIPWPRLWTHLRLAWELHRRPPDLFFTPAHVIPFTYRGPAVATVHDLGYLFFPQAHTRTQKAYLQWSTRHNAQRSRRVLADSEATRQDLTTHLGTPSQKIDVVYPGIDPELQPVHDEEVLSAVQAKYGIAAPYFLYLGTLQPRKNVGRLVEAFANAPAAGNQQLVLAGKPGWLSQPIMEQIAALPAPVAQRVRVTGYVAEEDKAALLSGATALLFPSLYEGFGFPVLEAQACETPVLTSNSSSLPEVAGEAALLVDPERMDEIRAGIERLAQDEALRRRLVEAGRSNVRRFNWQKAAAAALRTLEEAVP